MSGLSVPQEVVQLVGKQAIELEMLRRELDRVIAERDLLTHADPGADG